MAPHKKNSNFQNNQFFYEKLLETQKAFHDIVACLHEYAPEVAMEHINTTYKNMLQCFYQLLDPSEFLLQNPEVYKILCERWYDALCFSPRKKETLFLLEKPDTMKMAALLCHENVFHALDLVDEIEECHHPLAYLAMAKYPHLFLTLGHEKQGKRLGTVALAAEPKLARLVHTKSECYRANQVVDRLNKRRYLLPSPVDESNLPTIENNNGYMGGFVSRAQQLLKKHENSLTAYELF